jgi:hypothetical protein
MSSGCAYGLRIDGDVEPSWLNEELPLHREWPAVSIEADADAPVPERESFSEREVVLRLADGSWVQVQRDGPARRIGGPSDPTAIVHPFLAAVAVVQAGWDGRLAVHGGAFLAGAAAWGVIGAKGAGKSSLLAALHAEGETVLSDDLLVASGDELMSGPRSLDLRPDVPEALAAGSEPVRGGSRRRLRLAAAPASAPLAGWIHLVPGPRVHVEPLAGAERLRRLADPELLALPGGHPGALLDWASIVAYELQMPRHWDAHEPAVAALREKVAS